MGSSNRTRGRRKSPFCRLVSDTYSGATTNREVAPEYPSRPLYILEVHDQDLETLPEATCKWLFHDNRCCEGCGGRSVIHDSNKISENICFKNPFFEGILQWILKLLTEKINQVNGIGCVDSGATHSIAGEGLYKILPKQGMKFIKESIGMAFADGRSSNAQVLTTHLIVNINNRVVRTKSIILP
ncbi:hypothetical protein AVEN_226614-1 [Araneus ventricosus]|uniref:Uncharacterized protein n=1 Tax=Araneus ventricosus TaxID=182803 RepID=A0A4Y2TH32_ARAVE|nr:hypothetical protein AVEN_226614-1 [Araneus ventricosus]